jgi:hypothetical protein
VWRTSSDQALPMPAIRDWSVRTVFRCAWVPAQMRASAGSSRASASGPRRDRVSSSSGAVLAHRATALRVPCSVASSAEPSSHTVRSASGPLRGPGGPDGACAWWRSHPARARCITRVVPSRSSRRCFPRRPTPVSSRPVRSDSGGSAVFSTLIAATSAPCRRRPARSRSIWATAASSSGSSGMPPVWAVGTRTRGPTGRRHSAEATTSARSEALRRSEPTEPTEPTASRRW